MGKAFTAKNAALLSRQIDEAKRFWPDFTVNFGREKEQGTWWTHGALGANVKTGLTFSEMVADIEARLDAHMLDVDA